METITQNDADNHRGGDSRVAFVDLYQCTGCQKYFKNVSNLGSHLKTCLHRGGKRKISCPLDAFLKGASREEPEQPISVDTPTVEVMITRIMKDLNPIDIQDYDARTAYLFDHEKGRYVREYLTEIGIDHGPVMEFIQCINIMTGGIAPEHFRSAMRFLTKRTTYIAWRVGDDILIRRNTPEGIMDFLKSCYMFHQELIDRATLHEDEDIRLWGRAMQSSSNALRKRGQRTTFSLCDLVFGKVLYPPMKRQVLTAIDYIATFPLDTRLW